MIALIGVIAQLAIVAHGPESTNACQPFELTVAVRAPGMTVPQITAPILAPFDILSSSPSPQVTIEAGSPGSILAEFRYKLTTDQTGVFTIPSFEARLAQSVARSRPLRIQVNGPRADNVPSIVTRARVDTGLEVNFRAIASPETVYVGQQVNYEVAVFLNENVSDRLRRNPTFYPPDIRSMLAYDLPSVKTAPRRRVGSRCFDALVYQRALFPLIAGKFVIPPSQLVYALSTSAGFFSREETHDVQTDRAQVIAVDPPVASRPANWTGAVGDLRLRARLDTTVARVGDPLLLTVQVTGAGNVKLFPRPDVTVPWASVVRGDERVRVDSMSSRIRGYKEFDWVLTPRVAGELDVPPIQYSYFNPDRRRYMLAESPPVRVRVGSGALAAADTVHTEEALSIRPRYRGPIRAPMHQHFGFWLLVAAAPLPLIGFHARDRRRRAAVAESAATRLERIARGIGSEAPTPPTIRRAFGEALGERLGLPPTVFTRPGALARALRRSGVSREAAEGCERLMRELDGAAYSRDGGLAADAAQRATSLYARADAEALPREEIRLPLSALGILLAASLSIGTAVAASTTVEIFDQGVAAYSQRDYRLAQDAFREVARQEPRAADAWANFGTASWAAGDTARAVAGWQRALRLEPLATDVRDRVELTHGLPVTSAGYVPPIPLSVVGGLGLLLWVAGWGIAAWRVRRGARVLPGLTAAIIAGGIALVATFGLEEQLTGKRVGVVRMTAQLRVEPVLGAARGANALVGEVVRIRGVRGAWSLVMLDDGREGWMDASLLIPVDQRQSIAD
ncbi:MAG TPA: BatD family protein [Gemmatimonadaceae bacterium]|nr:BatD family protein [Gemmatimonadaceae bacterium]